MAELSAPHDTAYHAPHHPKHPLSPGARKAVVASLAVFGSVLVLMMILGLTMRLAQGQLISIPDELFYQMLTMHGNGMVGSAAIGGAAIMWYFLGQYVHLSTRIYVLNLVLFVIGAVMIIGAVFGGGFAGAWTFLYPLPAKSMGVWDNGAATTDMAGVLLIGTGFLLLHLDCARAILARYHGLGRAMGWPQLFAGHDISHSPPAAVIASTMVLIANIAGLVFGAAVLIVSIVGLYVPSLDIGALAAKNMIYFFGHVFTNACIYMGIIAVYELLPVFTDRPWKTNKAFLAGWAVSAIMIMAAYPHHLMMDHMPHWLLATAQVLSYVSGLPVVVVTVYGAAMIVYRSGMRWTLAAGLLLLGAFGWGVGVIPAIVDATIRVNAVMHNTLWVPGHFHTYFLVGQISMVLGFMAHLARSEGRAPLWGGLIFGLFTLGGTGLTQVFLYSGWLSVPRRYAVYLPQWVGTAQAGALFAVLLVLGTTLLLGRFLLSLSKASQG